MTAANASTNSEPAEKRVRVAWLDIARGASILLVILYHATYDAFANSLPVWRLHWLNTFLEPVRLPTFFLVSGLLARGMLAAPLRDFLIRRVWLYLWLFALWKAIRWAYYGWVIENVRRPVEGSYPTQIIEELYRPVSGIWFLWALLIFFIVARIGRHVPTPMLAIAAIVSTVVLGGWLPVENFAHNRTLFCAIFFLVGAYQRDRVIALVERGGRWTLPAAVAIFIVTFALASELPALAGPLRLLQSFAGVVAGCRLAMLAATIPAIRIPLAYFGQNTLPIYVAHAMVLMTLISLVAPGIDGRAQAHLLVLLAVPVAVGVTLALKRAADGAGLRFLYTAPAVWQWFPLRRARAEAK